MKERTPEEPIFSPSLMCMDLRYVAGQMEILNRHCDVYHVDIMDGHFAKNIALSPAFVSVVRSLTSLPVDAHLMVTQPGDYIDTLAAAGASVITVHAETIGTEAFRTIRRIQAAGCQVGVALCPATPLAMAESYLGYVDVLTIMTVDVGYAGQPFIPEMVEKIRLAAALRQERGHHYVIQSDGANNPATYRALYGAGTRMFVMGSSGLFRPGVPLEEAYEAMRRDFGEAVGIQET